VHLDLFTLLIGLGALVAGFLGSLTGLGGGVVIVPLLTLGFGVDIRYAIGASLVSVIATSSAAAAAYVRDGYSNLRIGMFLEVATTLGAVGGALIASRMPVSAVAIVFGAVLLWSAYLSLRHSDEASANDKPDPLATRLKMDSSYPTPDGPVAYHVAHVPMGWGIMVIAGGLSGLLGIGSGALKVLAMDQVMRLPFKVSTTTSNFMIGVTAAASAGLYLKRGYIDPALAAPVILGVVVGAMLGTRALVGARPAALRKVFVVVLVALGCQMIYHGVTGAFARG
jgi:uncharacterized membrane protein YfcA